MIRHCYTKILCIGASPFLLTIPAATCLATARASPTSAMPIRASCCPCLTHASRPPLQRRWKREPRSHLRGGGGCEGMREKRSEEFR